MLKLRERLAWLIFEHQVFGNFIFFSFFFYNRSICSTGNFKSVEGKFLKFRGWKYFKGHLIVLIFQFDRSSHQFAIRGAIVWKIRMENHRKSYSSLFTILSPFLFIAFIKRTFSLSYPSKKNEETFEAWFESQAMWNGITAILLSEEEKPPPFISSIIATGTVL